MVKTPRQIMSKEVRAYLSRIGAKGGAAARGRAKRRGSAEHYAALARKRWHPDGDPGGGG